MSVDKFEQPERPAYRVLDVAGFWGPNDQLWEEGSEIYLDSEPALEMEPLNQAARERYTAMLERLDEAGRAAAEKAGKPYVGLPRNLEGGLAIATAIQRAEMSVMGNTHKEAANIAPVKAEEVSELGRRPRGRPRKLAEG